MTEIPSFLGVKFRQKYNNFPGKTLSTIEHIKNDGNSVIFDIIISFFENNWVFRIFSQAISQLKKILG